MQTIGDTKSMNVSPKKQVMLRTFHNGSLDLGKQPAFKVIAELRKPDPAKWNKQRLFQLTRLPEHRSPRDKSVILPPQYRNNSPMTMEDRQQKQSDLDLRNILRNGYGDGPFATLNHTNKSILNKSMNSAPLASTIPMPPSFYDEDSEKWKSKFEKTVQDRTAYKKVIYRKLELSPFTKNLNLADPSILLLPQTQTNLNSTKNTTESEFKRVMQRRRSRQSTYAQNIVDFDYAGNAGEFAHVFKQKNSQTGSPNNSMLNFEMKLRSYKNDTDFKPTLPWQYPQKKNFFAKDQYKEENRVMNQTSGEFKIQYDDKFPEKNQFVTRELIDKHIGMMQYSFWEFGLRNRRNKKRKVPAIDKPEENQ